MAEAIERVHPIDNRLRQVGQILFVGIVFLAAVWILFGATGRDDNYITYWAAQSFAQQGRIANYNGLAIEQSSSLLHALLLGALSFALSRPTAELGLSFSLAFGFIAVLTSSWLSSLIQPKGAVWAAIGTAAFLPLMYWSASGMDASLDAFCLVLMAGSWTSFGLGADRRYWKLLGSLPYLLARPEATLVAVLAACILLALSEDRKRDIWIVGMVFIMAVALAAFRLGWTGYPLPLPALAKGALSGKRIVEGFFYIGSAVPLLFGLVGLKDFQTLPAMRPAFAISVAVLCFIVMIGGDWMEAWRFLAPLGGLVGLGVARLRAGWRWAAASATMVVLICGVMPKSTGTPSWKRDQVNRIESRFPDSLWSERVCVIHVRDLAPREALGRVLDRLTPGRAKTTILSGQMGLICYYSKLRYGERVGFIDQYGLCDDFLRKRHIGHPSPSQGGSYVAVSEILGGLPRREWPEVYFDVHADQLNEALKAGYRLVYAQGGTLVGGMPGREFILVRPDLADKVGTISVAGY